MPNQYVNQVGLADGTILIDLTNDMATVEDVAAGQISEIAIHDANGK